MARQFRFLPGCRNHADLPPKCVDAFLQLDQDEARGLILDGGFHLRHLALDLLQFLLRFFCGSHDLIDNDLGDDSTDIV